MRVLIVEDSVALSEVVAEGLRNRGWLSTLPTTGCRPQASSPLTPMSGPCWTATSRIHLTAAFEREGHACAVGAREVVGERCALGETGSCVHSARGCECGH
jgi:hypothetical protein